MQMRYFCGIEFQAKTSAFNVSDYLMKIHSKKQAKKVSLGKQQILFLFYIIFLTKEMSGKERKRIFLLFLSCSIHSFFSFISSLSCVFQSFLNNFFFVYHEKIFINPNHFVHTRQPSTQYILHTNSNNNNNKKNKTKKNSTINSNMARKDLYLKNKSTQRLVLYYGRRLYYYLTEEKTSIKHK